MDKKIDAKFTRLDDSSIIVKGIDEDDLVDVVHTARDEPLDPVFINAGRIKKIDIIDENGDETQTIYGGKNEL